MAGNERRKRQRGVVLILVLFIISGLSLVSIELNRTILLDHVFSLTSRSILASKPLLNSCETLAALFLVRKEQANGENERIASFAHTQNEFSLFVNMYNDQLKSGSIRISLEDENSRFPLKALYAEGSAGTQKAEICRLMFERMLSFLLLRHGYEGSHDAARLCAREFLDGLLSWGGETPLSTEDPLAKHKPRTGAAGDNGIGGHSGAGGLLHAMVNRAAEHQYPSAGRSLRICRQQRCRFRICGDVSAPASASGGRSNPGVVQSRFRVLRHCPAFHTDPERTKPLASRNKRGRHRGQAVALRFRRLAYQIIYAVGHPFSLVKEQDMQRIGKIRGQDGFTLLELMIVIVILGILGAVVAPRFMDEPDKARVVQAKMQIENLSTAVKKFYLDNAFYPSTEQGLDALVTKPDTGRAPRNYPPNGYMSKIPRDPWGNDYVYVAPGRRTPFEIMSLGADGVEGGDGFDADIWNDDVPEDR